jgi:CheY-like chemotaxis protein
MDPGKRRILIVDDEPAVLAVMVEALRGVPGYEVHGVSSPQEAYRIATARPPDLLIADYNMPLLRGDQLFLCLGVDPNDASKAVPRPKLLLISGAISDAEVHHLSEFVNGTAAMSKPFTPAQFLHKVAELLAPASS